MRRFSFNKIDKKYKYFVQSALVGIFIYVVSSAEYNISLSKIVISVFVFVLGGTFIIHYPNIKLQNLLFSILMPLSLIAGALLSFYYFPNFGLIFKIGVTVAFSAIYYLVSLVDNIFLVIQDREEVIPLYRVALTWGQILQVIVAIPLFAGIFKLPVNGLTQCFLAGVISFLFNVYQLWGQKYDKDSKNVRVGEAVFLSAIVFFLVFAAGAAVSFTPTEPFLRALMEASVLMFGLIYVNSHLKNDISKKILYQYLFIILLFLTLLAFFIP
jgi:hypothetical protein